MLRVYHEPFQDFDIINLCISYKKNPCGKYYYCLYFTGKDTKKHILKSGSWYGELGVRWWPELFTRTLLCHGHSEWAVWPMTDPHQSPVFPFFF